MVGNSSSGLLEAPTFRVATINIGDRQKGRIIADSVICCYPSLVSIREAFEKLYSNEFQNILVNVNNPYGTGGASKKIKEIIKSINLIGIVKKKFYDMQIG
jgi:GDP/UDP-N,N'-diacetylbacillosamine 2-epimerase (hydrolysing)